MPGTFTIPSVFTAIDKFSSPVKKMGNTVHSFASRAEAGVARAERGFRRMTPAISGATRQFLSFAKAAVITAGIMATINFSVSEMKQYDQATKSLQAITGVSEAQFKGYKKEIFDVAKAQKVASREVATTFEVIASDIPTLLDNAKALGQVSDSAIILSKASGDDLKTATTSLTGTLNQFNLTADQSRRVIDAMAAGNVAGNVSVSQLSQGIDKFGGILAGMNGTVEEAVAAQEVLGKVNLKGAEAGTQLRGVLLKLSTAKTLPDKAIKDLQRFGVNADIVQDKTRPLADRLREISKIAGDEGALKNVFGEQNILAAQTLLQNTELFEKILNQVSGNEAFGKAADLASTKTDTLTDKLKELTNQWSNIITGSDGAGKSLTTVKTTIEFLTDNLETIVSVGAKILLFFAAWKAIIIAAKIALAAYNVVLGITGALSGTASIAIGKNAVALGAYKTVVALATAKQWLLNAALSANPIGLIIIAIAALIALIVVIIKKYNQWGAALALVTGPLGLIINLIQSFRRNWDMIVTAFKEKGILGGLNAIGLVIIDSILMPLQQVLKIISNLTGFEWAENAMKDIEKFRAQMGVNVTTDESGNPLTPTPLINPEQSRQEAMREIVQTNNAKVSLDINDPDKRVKAQTDDPEIVDIKISSTWAQAFG